MKKQGLNIKITDNRYRSGKMVDVKVEGCDQQYWHSAIICGSTDTHVK